MSEEEPAAAISMVFKLSPPIALSEASSAARASTSCAAAGATDSAHSAASIQSLRTIPSSSVLRTYEILKSFIKLPLKIAVLSASLRNFAFSTRSTVTGQLNGTSVP